ncbi:hypothetical protein GO730_29880 [Spirosoma sp. HMF3257]|uniref:Bacteriocin n=1 Tax=Spirosoma telluris TaxID=2183553 RepID=A0A327NPI7_9BACT|nr:hypothetical protein [Spirosoma telluris]RAI77321.1 hypothetical protein HMF3257_29790 [Spirosoma telluris]
MEKQELTPLSVDSMVLLIGGDGQDNTTKCLLSIFGSGAAGYLTGIGMGGGFYQVLSTFSGMALGAASGCF